MVEHATEKRVGKRPGGYEVPTSVRVRGDLQPHTSDNTYSNTPQSIDMHHHSRFSNALLVESSALICLRDRKVLPNSHVENT